MDTTKIASGKPILPSLGFLLGELNIRGCFDNMIIEERKSSKNNSSCQRRMGNVQRLAKEIMRNMENMKIASRKPYLLSLGLLPDKLKISRFLTIKVTKEKNRKGQQCLSTSYRKCLMFY